MNYDTPVIPTLIWYYYICHREVWLMSRHLEPSQSNPFIEIGRLISESTYAREKKQIQLEHMVIDLIKKEGKDIIVCEIKKSSRFEKAAKMQLAYYLLNLKRLGIEAKGELLFPKEKKKVTLELTNELEEELKEAEREIKNIILMPHPPKVTKIIYCKNCGYKEFCYA
ncbi:MAG: CRISPR-associated protein Cas4 [Ignisphaera sp.]